MFLRTVSKRQTLMLSAVTLVFAVSLCLAGVADPNMSDPRISDAVENEIFFDPSVPSDAIDMDTSNGVVTLSGTVDSLLAKERAARIARAVKGVRSVINRVEVRPREMRSDGAIRNDVRTALLADPATDSYQVDIQVNNGSG